MLARLFLLILLALPATAFAEETKFDWWFLGEASMSQGRTFTYVDRASIVKKGKLVVANTFYYPERAFPNGEQSSLAQQLFDCKKKTYTLLTRSTWDSAGEFLGTRSWQGSPAEPVLPGSAGEAVRRFACGDGFVTATAVSDPRVHARSVLEPQIAADESSREDDPIVGGYGTGFFVSGEGQLVTSHHVIEGAKTISIVTSDGTQHPANVVRTSPLTDLAVLKVNYRPSTFLSFAAANSAQPGDRVFTFGFPVMELLGSEPKFTDGAISSLSGMGGEAAFAQISVPIQPGNSGGPLVNEQGDVGGVIAATAAVQNFMKATGTLPQNIGWAVRGEYVIPLINAGSPMKRRTREEAISLVRNSVVLIIAEH